MLDTDAYSEWNPFVIERPTPPPPARCEVGDPILLKVRWHTGGTAASTERVTRARAVRRSTAVRKAFLEYQYRGAARHGRAHAEGDRLQELARLDDGGHQLQHVRAATTGRSP